MKLSKTRTELLRNTVKRYNKNNRATYGSGQCAYLTKDGKRCAIGAEISKKKAKLLESNVLGHGTGVEEYENFEVLPKRLRDMGQEFLMGIQDLHDTVSYWNEKGLSEDGETRVKEICKEFDIDIKEVFPQ